MRKAVAERARLHPEDCVKVREVTTGIYVASYPGCTTRWYSPVADGFFYILHTTKRGERVLVSESDVSVMRPRGRWMIRVNTLAGALLYTVDADIWARQGWEAA